MSTQNQGAQPQQKVRLTISQIKEDLKNGIDRKGIKLKYDLTPTEVAELFQHPKLKGLRVRPASKVELIDDTEDEVVATGQAATGVSTSGPEAKAAPAKKASQPQPQGEPIKEVAVAEDSTEDAKGVW